MIDPQSAGAELAQTQAALSRTQERDRAAHAAAARVHRATANRHDQAAEHGIGDVADDRHRAQDHRRIAADHDAAANPPDDHEPVGAGQAATAAATAPL